MTQFTQANLLAALQGLPSEDEDLAQIEPLVRVVKPTNKSKPLKPQNVVAMAKARLKEVKSELRRMKALEKERGQLERLIAAADAKPDKRILREVQTNAG